MPARRRGGGISPIDSASTAASSPREDWLICAQVEVRHSPGYKPDFEGPLDDGAAKPKPKPKKKRGWFARAPAPAPSPVPESPVRRLDDLNLDDDID
jgi:hypothetical protein